MHDPDLSLLDSETHYNDVVSVTERAPYSMAVGARRKYLPFLGHAGFFTGLARWGLVVHTLAAQSTTSITKS